MGDWKVILPETGTNKVLNPVAMGTGNYSALNSMVITQSSGASYSGYLCYKGVSAAGQPYGGIALVLSALSNAIHYVTYRLNDSATYVNPPVIYLDGANAHTPTLLGKEGNWFIYGAQISAAQSNASVALWLAAPNEECTYYIGHIQVEQNTYPTTAITGDIKGFNPNGYYWNGSAHASSSTRSAQERSGGLEVDLDTTYNFKVKYGEGSGMPPITHHVQGMALLPGALYQGHKVEPRVLDLVSATKANTATTVSTARKNFINAVKPDRVSPDQPVIFRYYGPNSNKSVDFYAYYDSGMEFQLASGVVDQPVARFICYDPFCYETHTESYALTNVNVVANADYIVRKINGVWYNVSTDFNSDVECITRGTDGCIYIGGFFTDVGATTGDYIVKWNPYTSAISSLTGGSGSGTNNYVRVLATASNGDIYLGGDFHLAGAIANTVHVAYWDVSASEFVALSTGLNDVCESMVFGHDGSLYLGGSFVDQGDANGDYIVKWDGAAFSSLGTGMNGRVFGLAVAPNGDIYATGAFTLAGGVANTKYIARWNGTVWLPLGTGLDGEAYTLAIDKAGNVYVGGSFTHADGVSCDYIAKWNGATFEPLGIGTNNYVWRIIIDNNELLYASGSFTSAGGLVTNRFAVWNGSTWAYLDINFPGAPVVSALLKYQNDIYIGYDTSGTAYSSYLNTFTNNGSASAYPVIKIKRTGGTSAIAYYIKSETTGNTLWLNYSLLDNETLTIDLTPGNRSVKSDFFGDVWRAILRSSDLSSFCLLPGSNSISFFVMPGGGAAVYVWMEWKIAHWAADTVAA